MMHSLAKVNLHSSAVRPLGLPAPPQTPEDTGLGFLFLVEHLCKVVCLHGQMRLADLSAHCRLPLGVLEPVLAFMRAERLVEVSRRAETAATVAYTLTDAGRSRAHEFLQKSQYAGVAPVPVKSYVERVRQQSVRDVRVTQERIATAFEGVVIRPSLLEQFGSAMNSGRAIFMYGPAGAGKSFIGEQLGKLLVGHVAIPHAILVENEVIQIFDPLVHQAVGMSAASTSLDRGGGSDTRWLSCHRPVVATGGELTLAMLDLQFDERARFYQAPPQIKANNGLFIVDDLGRQLVSPQSLMNRWIVPMDRRVDYLALHTGTKFMVPFDVIVVFSSNLPPASLADEAFLRRLGYKIRVGTLDEAEYEAIFKQECQKLGIPFSERGLHFVLHKLHRDYETPLLACIPRDLLAKLRDFAEYHGSEPCLSEELLEWAWNNYYAEA
jgi:DNA-binding PadR family transcriptional regulator